MDDSEIPAQLILFLCLGNCKDCDKRTTEAGKSEETIRENIIHDNPPGGVIEAVSIVLFKFL